MEDGDGGQRDEKQNRSKKKVSHRVPLGPAQAAVVVGNTPGVPRLQC